MQIDLQNLLGAGAQISSTAPTLGMAGEFDLVLAQTQFEGASPPGVAPPPFLLGMVSANGTEEVSQIQPNAVASKLDFLPTDTEVKISESANAQNPSLDSLLAAMNLSFRSLEPIVVSSVPPAAASMVVSASIVSAPNTQLSPISWAPAAMKVADLLGARGVQHSQANPTFHEGDFAPLSHLFQSDPLESTLVPVSLPSVLIEGLSRQFGAKQVLDPEMVSQLGLQSMKAAPLGPGFSSVDSTTLDEFRATRPELAVSTPERKVADSKLLGSEVATKSPTSAPVVAVASMTQGETLKPNGEPQVKALGLEKKNSTKTTSAALLLGDPEIPSDAAAESRIDAGPDKLLGSEKKAVSATTVTSGPFENSNPVTEELELVQPISELTAGAPIATREPLATSRTDEVAKPAQLPERTQREVVQQTVDRIEAMAIQRPMSQVVIHLNPEHLGEIAIKVRMMGNRSEAEITATDERVVQALDGNRPQLVQAIESKGFALSSLTMQFGGERGDQNPAQREDFARAMNSFQNASTDGGETAAVPTYGSSQNGGLNLVI